MIELLIGCKIILKKFKGLKEYNILWPLVVELEIYNIRKFEKKKISNMWTLQNKFLNNQWIKEEITKKVRKYIKMRANEEKHATNEWCLAKSVLREKYTTSNA